MNKQTNLPHLHAVDQLEPPTNRAEPVNCRAAQTQKLAVANLTTTHSLCHDPHAKPGRHKTAVDHLEPRRLDDHDRIGKPAGRRYRSATRLSTKLNPLQPQGPGRVDQGRSAWFPATGGEVDHRTLAGGRLDRDALIPHIDRAASKRPIAVDNNRVAITARRYRLGQRRETNTGSAALTQYRERASPIADSSAGQTTTAAAIRDGRWPCLYSRRPARIRYRWHNGRLFASAIEYQSTHQQSQRDHTGNSPVLSQPTQHPAKRWASMRSRWRRVP